MDLDYEHISEEAKKVLDDLLGRSEPLKAKDRLAIPPQPMPSQPSGVRIKNMNEVSIGYTPEQARVEARRCLQCKNAPCIKGCPVTINIPAFLEQIAENNFKEAIDVIKQSSLLPAICGRVCPQ